MTFTIVIAFENGMFYQSCGVDEREESGLEEKDYISIHEFRIERLILLIYTGFSIAMITMSFLLSWGYWIPILIPEGMIACWICHLKNIRSRRFRAYLISCMIMMNMTFFGLHTEDFLTLLPTFFCTMIALLGLFRIVKILYLILVVYGALFAYHALILQTIHAGNWRGMLVVAIQFFTVVTVAAIIYYMIRTQLAAMDQQSKIIDRLRKAEHSKDDFVANVSHEIRTPINTVCGISELILREAEDETMQEYANDIYHASRGLLSVVSDILDFSELQAGAMDLYCSDYNITSTINDVMNSTIAWNSEKNLEIILDCDPRIPCGLSGDEQKLRRVMMNIINNAIKFTEKGGVTINIFMKKKDYGINLIVKVKDTGIGMDEASLETLFTSFNQVDTKRNRQEGGVGLGLAISKAIIKRMGGFINVSSVKGKGTEVRFSIPQKVADSRPAIVVENRDEVRVICYINLEKFQYASVRDDYMRCIEYMAEQLEVTFRFSHNLNELKRHLEREQYTHLFLGYEEYQEDVEFFTGLSEHLLVALVIDRGRPLPKQHNFICIYKPFYVMSIAAVLNGDYKSNVIDGTYYENKPFIAPEARILAVDDNLMNLKVVESLLRPYKIKVFSATGGKEALEKLKTMDYDFVFMDHMMPEMDGVETLHAIRNNSSRYFQTVPVIALTANAIAGAREMFLSEGFAEFVAKPIETSILDRVLRKFIPDDKIIFEEEKALAEETKEAAEEKKETAGEKQEKLEVKQERTEEELPKEMTEEKGFQIGEDVNVETGLMYSGGDMEIYQEFLNIYVENSREKIPQIEQHFEKEDWENYGILVHAVKSTSLNIGAEKLSEMAKELEAAAKAEDAAFVKEHHPAMLAKLLRTLEAIEKHPRPGTVEQNQRKDGE